MQSIITRKEFHILDSSFSSLQVKAQARLELEMESDEIVVFSRILLIMRLIVLLV